MLDRGRDDIVFVGDMNWTDKNDGAPPLPPSWYVSGRSSRRKPSQLIVITRLVYVYECRVDAWPVLHGSAPGFTYDTAANAMLSKKGRRKLQLRLDRAFVRLSRWRLDSVEMVGREAVPGVEFEGRSVLPSDHYGLRITLVKAAASN